jgi:hypothetical protein
LLEYEKNTEDEEHMLRLLTPVAKLYLAKKCVAVASEGLECFGGQGYIEDTGLPAILRNAQVTPIWEGTTNVLSLDTLRAIAKSQGAVIKSFYKNVTQRLAKVQDDTKLANTLSPAVARVEHDLSLLVKVLPKLQVRHTV